MDRISSLLGWSSEFGFASVNPPPPLSFCFSPFLSMLGTILFWVSFFSFCLVFYFLFPLLFCPAGLTVKDLSEFS